MDSVDYAIGSDKHIPFSVTWTGAEGLGHETQTCSARSVCEKAVSELELTGVQVLVGCICFLGAIRLALWAVLTLWLSEP